MHNVRYLLTDTTTILLATNAVESRNPPAAIHISTGGAEEICEFLVEVAGCWVGDRPSLVDAIGIGTQTRLVPRELVDEVVLSAGRKHTRRNKLPACVMVYFVMAMALFYGDSYKEMMRKLADGPTPALLGVSVTLGY